MKNTTNKLKPCSFLYDSVDEKIVSSSKWYITTNGKGLHYAARTEFIDGKKKIIYLHRKIMKAGPGEEVDHINHDGLDNRRSNLRLVTHSQNLVNARSSIGVSGNRGVWKSHNGKGRWVAVLKRHGKRLYLGTYGSSEEAHAVWLCAAQVVEEAWNRRAR